MKRWSRARPGRWGVSLGLGIAWGAWAQEPPILADAGTRVALPLDGGTLPAEGFAVSVRPGETVILPATLSGYVSRLICDDLEVVRPRIEGQDLLVTGLKEGTTQCGVVSSGEQRLFYRIRVIKPPPAKVEPQTPDHER